MNSITKTESKKANKELLTDNDIYHAIYHALNNIQSTAETIIKRNVDPESFELEIAELRYILDAHRHCLCEIAEQTIIDSKPQ